MIIAVGLSSILLLLSSQDSKGREPPRNLAAMGRGAVNRKGTTLLIVAV
jgi:hypothetical protein